MDKEKVIISDDFPVCSPFQRNLQNNAMIDYVTIGKLKS
jgi:hypothetical protein